MVASHIDCNLDLLKTENSKIIDITHADFKMATVELSKILNIDYGTLRRYPHWFIYNGEYYYLKQRDHILPIIREFLGVELSCYMDLPTIDYNIASIEDEIVGLMSKNFRVPGINYMFTVDSNKYDSFMRETVLKHPHFFSEEYARMLARYFIRNYFACQRDRTVNVECYKVGNHEYLAPLYDYENSFEEVFGGYEDAMFLYPFSEESINKMIKSNKYLKEYLEYILEFDFDKYLRVIENKHGILIPDEVNEEILMFGEERKEGLKKVYKYGA